uniref:hypothetical protein n=1 Tax=Fredinandcohnia onubensis TaxID=1571209 RepID=UPI003CCC23A8
GATGERGATGECECREIYCNVYYDGPLTVNVPTGSSVPFDEEGECSETDGTPDFVRNATSVTVENAGVYLVNYSVIFNNTPATNDVSGVFQIYVDGDPIPASRFGTRVTLASTAAGNTTRLQVNGEAIVSIPAGGVLELRNIGGSTVHIRTEVAGTPINGAAMTIVLLEDVEEV